MKTIKFMVKLIYFLTRSHICFKTNCIVTSNCY